MAPPLKNHSHTRVLLFYTLANPLQIHCKSNEISLIQQHGNHRIGN